MLYKVTLYLTYNGISATNKEKAIECAYETLEADLKYVKAVAVPKEVMREKETKGGNPT